MPTDSRSLFPHLFSHHDLIVCYKVLMTESSRSSPVKLTITEIWCGLTNGGWFSQFHSSSVKQQKKARANYTGVGNLSGTWGFWLQIQLWMLFWLLSCLAALRHEGRELVTSKQLAGLGVKPLLLFLPFSILSLLHIPQYDYRS